MEPELRKILKRTGNYPMHRYIDKEECTEEVMDGLNWNIAACAYPRDYGKMPCDDDTNYTIMGYKIIERYGKDFTAENVASMWLATQVKNAYCTAERVAYRNFVNGYTAPRICRVQESLQRVDRRSDQRRFLRLLQPLQSPHGG